MIQRIQSVYLFLATAAIYSMFLFPIANLTGQNGLMRLMVNGIYENINNVQVQTQEFMPQTIACAVLGLLPFILIFLFKNRKLQSLLCYITILLVLGFSFWLAQTVKEASNTMLDMDDYYIGAGLPSVAVLFLILAAKAINRDQKLVKSVDRLR